MRRTKEEAALTREAILNAALHCFNRRGLSKTTLDDIAAAAKVTRGAIYWHFKGKQEILQGLRERLTLPVLDRADTELLQEHYRPPLERVEYFLQEIFADLHREPVKRQALELMHYKVEYVDELEGELHAGLKNMDMLAKTLEAVYEEARKMGELAEGMQPRLAAYETCIFMSGLVRLWLLDDRAGGFRKSTPALIQAHIASRRRHVPPRSA